MAKKQSARSRPNHRGKYVVVIFQTQCHSRDPFGSVSRHLLSYLQSELDDVIETAPDRTEIDIWIDSWGGDANAAYKLSLDLRSRCKWMRLVIPDIAKSAATLLALGVDEIFMSPAAELGPLDVQIDHPDRENVTVSGLNVAKALGFVSQFAVDYALTHAADVIEMTKLPRLEVLRMMSEFSSGLLEPIVGKLDPHLIHKAANELDIARIYALRMLSARNLPESEDEDDDGHGSPSAIADHLVNHYPAHDFVISIAEAKRELGLPVKALGEYLWGQGVSDFLKAYRHQFLEHRKTGHIIRVLDYDEVADIVSEANESDEARDEHEAAEDDEETSTGDE